MKTAITLFSLLLLIPACESGTDNTTDIPTEECSSGSTTDETNFRSAVTCRETSKNSAGCTATCVSDDFGSADCACTFPTDDDKGSCTCCLNDGFCSTSEFDDQICKP